MSSVLPARPGAVIALLVLLLTACGDVTVTAGYPEFDLTGYWWWPDTTGFVAHRTLSIQEPVEGRLRIRLEALSGSVAIVGEPGAGLMHLTAKLSVGSDTPEDAQAGLDHLGVTVTSLPDEIHVQTHQPGTFDGRHYAVDYTLHIPADREVLVTQTNGNIRMESIANAVSVDVMNGRVRLLGIIGDAIASVSNGDIDCSVTPQDGGEIMLSAVNGDIDLRIPTWTSAILSAFTSNGTIIRDNLNLSGVDQTARSLNGILGSGSGAIVLETLNGNISISGF